MSKFDELWTSQSSSKKNSFDDLYTEHGKGMSLRELIEAEEKAPGALQRMGSNLKQIFTGQPGQEKVPAQRPIGLTLPNLQDDIAPGSAYTGVSSLPKTQQPVSAPKALPVSTPALANIAPPDIPSRLRESTVPSKPAAKPYVAPETPAHLKDDIAPGSAYQGEQPLVGKLEQTSPSILSLMAGNIESALGPARETYMRTQSPEALKKVQDLEGELEQLLVQMNDPTNFFEKGIQGAIRMLPMQAKSVIAGLKGALPGAAAGAGTALVAGQLGPQVALPEELLSVPGMAIAGGKTGFALGSMTYMARLEAGHAYDQYTKEGVDHKNAVAFSYATGVVNAVLEGLQLAALAKAIPGLNTLITGAANTAKKKIVSEVLKNYAKFVAEQTGEEMLQRLVTDVFGEFAKIRQNATSDSDLPLKGAGEIAKGVLEEGIETFPTMAVTGFLPHAGQLVQGVNQKALTSSPEMANFEQYDTRITNAVSKRLEEIVTGRPAAEQQVLAPEVTPGQVMQAQQEQVAPLPDITLEQEPVAEPIVAPRAQIEPQEPIVTPEPSVTPNEPESGLKSPAYHAGDLGKSEQLGRQSGGRGTGHFGTGTYFVGNKEKIDLGGYRERPQHTVDLDGYKLFTPKTEGDALRAHDALKFVNDYWSILDRADEIVNAKNDVAELSAAYQNADPADAASLDAIDGILSRPIFNYLVPERMLSELSDMDKNSDEYARQVARIINKAEDALEWSGRAGKFLGKLEDFAEDVKALGIDAEKAKELVLQFGKEVTDKYGEDWFSSEEARQGDSISTRLMKALGYEGVDVRHIPSFDNTEYGTVVYDLKQQGKAAEQVAPQATEAAQEAVAAPEPSVTSDGPAEAPKFNAGDAERINNARAKLVAAARKAGYKIDLSIETVTSFADEITEDMLKSHNIDVADDAIVTGKTELSKVGDTLDIAISLLEDNNRPITQDAIHEFAEVWCSMWQLNPDKSYEAAIESLTQRGISRSEAMEMLPELLTDRAFDETLYDTKQEAAAEKLWGPIAKKFKAWLKKLFVRLTYFREKVWGELSPIIQEQADLFAKGDWEQAFALAEGDTETTSYAMDKKQPVVPWSQPQQEITSADTALKQIAAAFKTIAWEPGTKNADIGAGPYDLATEYLAEKGVTSIPWDVFGRPAAENEAAVRAIRHGQADTATVMNVLNVIAEDTAREGVIVNAADAIKSDGTAYFQIYAGDGRGEGRATTKGWQNNRRTKLYVDEIKEYFGDVKTKGNLITAKQPNKAKIATAITVETKKGTKITRSSKYGVGKQIGGGVYVHKDYAADVVPADVWRKAQSLLASKYPGFTFNAVKYDLKLGTVRFDEAADFDTAREPVPGNMVTVDTKTGIVSDIKNSQAIWHHKWLWVQDDYAGFDVVDSKMWSRHWTAMLEGQASGSEKVWQKQLADGEIEKRYAVSSTKGDPILERYKKVFPETTIAPDDRDFENVKPRSVNAIQAENPMVKKHIQGMAENLMKELNEAIKGERFTVRGEDGYAVETKGVKRDASPSIERVLDDLSSSYNNVRDALQRIIDDQGRENTALAKRIELIIDDNLTEGYIDMFGNEIPADQDYVELTRGEVAAADDNAEYGDVLFPGDPGFGEFEKPASKVAPPSLEPKKADVKQVDKRFTPIIDSGYGILPDPGNEVTVPLNTWILADWYDDVSNPMYVGKNFIIQFVNGDEGRLITLNPVDAVSELMEPERFKQEVLKRISAEEWDLYHGKDNSGFNLKNDEQYKVYQQGLDRKPNELAKGFSETVTLDFGALESYLQRRGLAESAGVSVETWEELLEQAEGRLPAKEQAANPIEPPKLEPKKEEVKAKPVEKPALEPKQEEKVAVDKEQAARRKDAERISSLADRLQPKIDKLRQEKQTNTPKRAREAAGRLKDAEKLEGLQMTLRNIANGIEQGKYSKLRAMRSMTEVEALESALRVAMYRYEEANSIKRTAESSPVAAAVKYAKIEAAVHIGHFERLLKAGAEKPGVKGITKDLKALLYQEGHLVNILGRLDDVEKVAKAVGEWDNSPFKDAVTGARRLFRMGIDSDTDLREFLQEYLQAQEKYKPTKQDELRAKQRDLIGAKIPGYFPTPKAVVDKMLSAADIKDGDTVLEPSAGQGHIADLIGVGKVDVVEINGRNREILELKGHKVVGDDALAIDKKYDKIVMNPPFERGQDIDHVRHAFDNNLKDGGTLVAIMSEGSFYRSDKKATGFREWLDSVGGTSEKLQEGAFKSSDRPTGVSTRMVTITKEAQQQQGTAASSFNPEVSALRQSKRQSNVARTPSPIAPPKIGDKIEPDRSGVITKQNVFDAINDFVKIYPGKVPSRDAAATYTWRSQHISAKAKFMYDLRVLTHELGHHLDELFIDSTGLKNQYDNELLEVNYVKSLLRAKPNTSPDVALAEGVAEYFNMRLTNPTLAESTLPQFHQAIENELANYPDLQDKLHSLQQLALEYQQQDARAETDAMIVDEIPREGAVANFYAKAVDELDILQKLTDFAIKQKPGLDPSMNPVMLARNARRSQSKAEYLLLHGQALFDGQDVLQRQGASLKEIITPIEKMGAGMLREFERFLVARHALEINERVANEQTGETMISGLRTEAAEDLLREIESKPYAKNFAEQAEQLYEYIGFTLFQLVESGVLSPEDYVSIRGTYKHYVPWYRAVDWYNSQSGQGGGKMGNRGSAVKRQKGADMPIHSPLQSIVLDTIKYTHLAALNKPLKAMYDLTRDPDIKGLGAWYRNVPADQVPTTVDIGDSIKRTLLNQGVDSVSVDSLDLDNILATFFQPSAFGKTAENVVSFFDNGERKFLQFESSELLYAVMHMDRDQLKTMGKFGRWAGSIMRKAHTAGPKFGIGNLLSDTTSTAIFSKNNFVPFVDSFKGFWEVLTLGDSYKEWLAAGGAMHSLDTFDSNFVRKTLSLTQERTLTEKMVEAVNVFSYFERFSTATEYSAKVGEYMKARKSGKDHLTAVEQASDVMIDHNRHGRHSDGFRAMVPFSGSWIQGTDKIVRSFKENPSQAMMRSLMYITLPTIALYMLNRKNPNYEELPEWQKIAAWNIPIGDPATTKLFLPIKKPYTLGFLFGSIPEKFMQYVDKQDKRAFEGIMKDALNETTFNMTFWPLELPLELAANYNRFNAVPIVPEREKDLPAAEQYGPYTPELVKLLGSIANASPRKIDHIQKQLTGEMGKLVNQTFDLVVPPLDGTPKQNKDFLDVPFLGQFVAESRASGSVSVERFYNDRDKLTKLKNKKNLSTAERQKLAGLKRMDNIAKQLADLRRQEREIHAHKKMTPDEKGFRLEDLQQRQINIVRRFYGLTPLP